MSLRNVTRNIVLALCSAGTALIVVAAVLSYTTYPRYSVRGDFGCLKALCCWNGVLHLIKTVRVNPNPGNDLLVEDRRSGWEQVLIEESGTEVLGFYWHDVPVLWLNGAAIVRHKQFDFPLWAPFILFAVYPATAFIRGPLRRWRRRKRGHCPNCGYNLTGNVSGVCPECGTKLDTEGNGIKTVV